MEINNPELSNAIRDLMIARRILSNVLDTFDASDGFHQDLQEVIWQLETKIFKAISVMVN